MNLSSHRRGQWIFVIVAILFFGFLVSSIVSRSLKRSSLFWSDGKTEIGSVSVGPTGSQVRLQDFHRVEVKNGKPAWEIRAKEAQYFPEQGVTHVNEAAVTIYRTRNSIVVLRSNSARLYLAGTSLTRADMEGNVVVDIDGSVFVATESANYDVATGDIRALDDVTINGPGFQVEGKGLLANVERQEIQVEENVRSRFEQWAQVPEGAAGMFGHE